MASAIDPNSLDITYPIVGTENDINGFYINWESTRANFASLKSEIESLQATTIIKTPLVTEDTTITNTSANKCTLHLDNNIEGNLISGPLMHNMRKDVLKNTAYLQNGDIEIDVAQGAFQQIVIPNSDETNDIINISFKNFINNALNEITLDIRLGGLAADSSQSKIIIFKNTRGNNLQKTTVNGIDYDSFTINQGKKYLFDLMTINGGTMVYCTNVSSFTL